MEYFHQGLFEGFPNSPAALEPDNPLILHHSGMASQLPPTGQFPGLVYVSKLPINMIKQELVFLNSTIILIKTEKIKSIKILAKTTAGQKIRRIAFFCY